MPAKKSFYHIYVVCWVFLTVFFVVLFVGGGSSIDVLEVAKNASNLDVCLEQKEIEILKLKIAVLEQELRNLGAVIPEDEFTQRKKDEHLHEFLSVFIFVSIIALRLFI
jgi:preprotein translocase subunit SecE